MFQKDDVEETENFLTKKKNIWKRMVQAPYLFLPMLESAHFTLLSFNLKDREWTHYNSLRPRSEEQVDSHFEKAKQNVSIMMCILSYDSTA